VLHPKTIQPVAQLGIPVRVLNSLKPEDPGTLVHAQANGNSLIRGITAIRDLCMVSVEGSGMLGVPGIAGRVFSAVASSGASILMITQSSSEQSICFVIRSDDAAAVELTVEKELELELLRGDIDHVKRQENVAIIAAVGAGMRGKPGIAARVFSALADRGINILSIAQGSSEYNISLVVGKTDADEGVRAIHRQFGLDKQQQEEVDHKAATAQGVTA
ncbi:MAG: ACT domain-containing protein, partial [Chloroflexi bacterium]|nr:ACT domain-containing protein [Chloroflexota bacterium]